MLKSEFRQGTFEIRMWPNKTADGNTKTNTPGLIAEFKENELEETTLNNKNVSNFESNLSNTNNNFTNNSTNNATDEFPILDELDRLAKVSLLSFKL